ncbi:BTB domain containing protein [Asbolus verrucosus]|uniref:BTB domain containing protein n=1 Tax=Asbolus verrucosus TaxID=1661398 RepID=A0A482V009_ASBVE|nr:BTB domain containing protein [Asbolus verrucosus]
MSSESNKEYSVNWKNHMSHVRKAFDHLLSSSELTDVTLCCEGKKIGAHKMLLSACSAYFRDTFKDVPCQHPVIILYGVEYGVLSDILHFIYNGEVSVDTSKLDSFLKTAQLLQISGLTDGTHDRVSSDNEQVADASVVDEIEEETYTQPVARETIYDILAKNIIASSGN